MRMTVTWAPEQSDAMLPCGPARALIWRLLQAYAPELSQFDPVQRGVPAWARTNDLMPAYARGFSRFGPGQALPLTLDGAPPDVQKVLALP